MIRLGGESHSGAVATTSTGLSIIGTAGVPSETEQDGTKAAIIIVVLLLQTSGNLVVNLLVVCLSRGEDLGGGGRGSTAGGEPVASTTDGSETGYPEQGG